MRIWYQVMAPVEEQRWRQHADSMRQRFPLIARPGTQVDVKGVAVMGPKVSQYRYYQFLHSGQAIENAMRAEREGYDAFIFAGMLDLGFHELREVVNIPVAFVMQSSFHVACLVAPKFALVTPSPNLLRWQDEVIRSYRLEGRAVPGVYMGMTDDYEITKGWADPEPYIEMFRQAARRAIAAGAAILIPGFNPLNSFLADHNVTEVDGIPVLDIQKAVVKTAEFLVDLRSAGIEAVRAGQWAVPPKDELALVRQMYGVRDTVTTG